MLSADPGLGSWLMRRDTSGLEQEFQNWIAPYVQEDALNSTMYVDCAHHAMGVGNVLRYGLRGLQRQAQARLQTETDVEKQTFLRCVIRAEDAVMRLCARFADEAERLCGTERDPVVQARLARIAISARRCPAEPAETFFEALNTMLLLKELGNGLESMGFAILGHVDRVLAPYYARDVQLGRLTVAQAQELVYWFCAMTDAKWDLSQALYGTNTAMSIGGCDENGTPVFNDITRWVLQCYLDCGLINPKYRHASRRTRRRNTISLWRSLRPVAGMCCRCSMTARSLPRRCAWANRRLTPDCISMAAARRFCLRIRRSIHAQRAISVPAGILR